LSKEITSLGKTSIIYGVGSVLTRSIGIITLPLFTSYLSKEEYGILAMLVMLSMVVQPIFSLGLSASMGILYFEKNDQQNKSQTVWSVFTLHIFTSTILVILAFYFTDFWIFLLRLPGEVYSYAVQISLMSVAITILTDSFSQRVQFEKQAILFVLASALSALVSVTVSVFTVVHLEIGFIGLIYGQLAGSFFNFLFFLILGCKETTCVIRLHTIKEVLRLGLPLVPSFALVFVIMHSNKYILEYYYGLDSVGVYSIGFNLGVTISIITGGISKAWYPFFINYISRKSECKIIFGRIFTYYIYSVGLICSSYFIFAKPVVLLLTDEKFHESYMVVGFVALAHFIQLFFNFFLPDLYFSKKVKYVSVVQGLSAVVSIPMFILLIKNYSIIGCAIGICISNSIAALFLYVWNKTLLKDSLRIKYQWLRILYALGLFFTSVCIYCLLPKMSLHSEIIKSIVILTFLSLVMYITLHSNEKEYVKANIKRLIEKLSYT
tara:strand:- start:2134 stop:3612 length:1479 start_codon:yes stop_codon:yes gene_type:complete